MSWENKVKFNRDERKVYTGRNHCCIYRVSTVSRQELIKMGLVILWTRTNA